MEKLPEEIWLKIFNKLDVKSLRNARMAYKSWNDVISESAHLMSKFILYSNFAPVGTNNLNKNKIFNIKIKDLSDRLTNAAYKNVIMIGSKRNPLPDEKFIQFASNNLKDLEKLHLENPPAISIVPILRSSASTLTHLTLQLSRKVNETQKIHFANLIYLKHQDTCDFLKFINAPKLETLQLDCVNCDGKNVQKFLKTCKNLKNLAFDTNVPAIKFKDIPFKLESIELSKAPSPLFNNFYRDFLKSQKESLKRFRMCNIAEVSGFAIYNEVLEFVADELNLTSLDLSGRYDYDENEYDFCKILPKNHTIKELKLNLSTYDTYSDRNMFCESFIFGREISEILKKCVAVESLTLNRKIYDIHDFFVEHNIRNLKYLHIEHHEGIRESFGIKNDNLETLSIGGIEEEYDFNELLPIITYFPRVKNIKMRIFSYKLRDLEDQIKKLFENGKLIEEISIEYGSFNMKNFVNGFKKYKSRTFRKLSVGIEKREYAIRLKEKFKDVDSFDANIYWTCDAKEEKMMAIAWNDEQAAANIKRFDQCLKIESFRGNKNKVDDDDEVDSGDEQSAKIQEILDELMKNLNF